MTLVVTIEYYMDVDLDEAAGDIRALVDVYGRVTVKFGGREMDFTDNDTEDDIEVSLLAVLGAVHP